MAFILLVDPDVHASALVREFLAASGHELMSVDGGERALEALRARPMQVVVTEVMVPALDGLALCRRIKSASATVGTRVIVMSILAASARAREAGADAFLRKPVTRARLLEAVQGVLGAPPSVPSEAPR